MRLAASAAGIPGTAEAASGSRVVDVVLDVEALGLIWQRAPLAAVEQPQAGSDHDSAGCEDEKLRHRQPATWSVVIGPASGPAVLVVPCRTRPPLAATS